MQTSLAYPKIQKVTLDHYFIPQLNTAVDQILPVLQLQGISRINFQSYNCPENCAKCPNAEYPKGTCSSCQPGFATNSLGGCDCQKSFNQTYVFGTLQPDIPDVLFNQEDKVLDSVCIGSSQFIPTKPTCYDLLMKFFNSKYLSSQIDTTTTFGTFFLTLTNSQGIKITTECEAFLTATSYLFTRVRDKNYLPKKQVQYLGSVTIQPGSDSLKFLVVAPLSDGNNKVSCVEEPGASYQKIPYVATICQFTIFFSFKEDFFGPEFPKTNFLPLYNKDLETQMFLVTGNTFSSRSIMLERFSNECLNCQLEADPGLIFRICGDMKCTNEIKNNTRMIDTTMFLFVTYQDHNYNFQRTISHVEILLNGALLNETVDYKLSFSSIGTNQAKLINFSFSKEGLMNYEIRLRYYDPTKIVTSGTTTTPTTSARMLQIFDTTFDPILQEYMKIKFSFEVNDPMNIKDSGLFNWITVTYIAIAWGVIMIISFFVFFIIKYCKGESFEEKSENGIYDMDVSDLNEFFKSGRNQKNNIFNDEKGPKNKKISNNASNIKASRMIELSQTLNNRNEDDRYYNDKYLPNDKSKVLETATFGKKYDDQARSQISQKTLKNDPYIPDMGKSTIRSMKQEDSEIVYSTDGVRKVKRKVRRLVRKTSR